MCTIDCELIRKLARNLIFELLDTNFYGLSFFNWIFLIVFGIVLSFFFYLSLLIFTFHSNKYNSSLKNIISIEKIEHINFLILFFVCQIIKKKKKSTISIIQNIIACISIYIFIWLYLGSTWNRFYYQSVLICYANI